GVGHHVRDGRIQVGAVFNGLLQFLKHVLRKPLPHNALVEHILAKYFRNVDLLAHSLFLSMVFPHSLPAVRLPAKVCPRRRGRRSQGLSLKKRRSLLAERTSSSS